MNGKALRLFHVSDIHFGREDREALDWVRQLVGDERPDALIVSGDLTMRARHREYAAARHWFTSLDAPAIISLGNHDMPYFAPVERLAAPYRRFRALRQAIGREADLGSLAVVQLKTTARAQWRMNWSKGCITRPALAKTLGTIDALLPGQQALVCAHHPLIEPGTEGSARTRRGQRALEELAKRGVLAVLSGHVHDPFDLTEETGAGPVRMIGAGTLSERLRTTPPSFNELRIEGGALEVIVRKLGETATAKPAGVEGLTPTGFGGL